MDLDELTEDFHRMIGSLRTNLATLNTAVDKMADSVTKQFDTITKLVGTGVAGVAAWAFQDYFAAMFRQQLQAVGKIISEVIFAPIQLYTESLQLIYRGFQNVINQLTSSFLDLHKILDESTADFFKITQAASSYTSIIRDSIQALREQGLQISRVAESAGALFQNTVLFRDAARSTKIELIGFVSTLEQAGVSASHSTRMIQILNKTLGESGQQTMQAAESVIHFARSVGVSGTQASEGFAQASSVLSAHGTKMIGIYKELLVQVRATGLSTQQLLGIAGQFDTFDQGARSVSMLNSLLGGPYLNSIEMVYMSETQRNRAILESIELAGKSWATMDRFERIAYAAAVGIRDMAAATEFFGGGLAAFDEALSHSAENARKQEALAEIARRSTTLFEGFKNALLALSYSFRPVIDFLRDATYALVAWNEKEEGAISKIALLVTGIGTLTSAFGPIGLLGALGLVNRYWGEIEGWLGGPGSRGAQLFQSFGGHILSAFEMLPDALSFIMETISALFESDRFSASFTRLVSTFTTMLRRSSEELASWIGQLMTSATARAMIAVGEMVRDNIDATFGSGMGQKIIDWGTELKARIKAEQGAFYEESSPIMHYYEDLRRQVAPAQRTVQLTDPDSVNATNTVAAEVRNLKASVNAILSMVSEGTLDRRREYARPKDNIFGQPA